MRAASVATRSPHARTLLPLVPHDDRHGRLVDDDPAQVVHQRLVHLGAVRCHDDHTVLDDHRLHLAARTHGCADGSQLLLIELEHGERNHLVLLAAHVANDVVGAESAELPFALDAFERPRDVVGDLRVVLAYRVLTERVSTLGVEVQDSTAVVDLDPPPPGTER